MAKPPDKIGFTKEELRKIDRHTTMWIRIFATPFFLYLIAAVFFGWKI